MSNPIDEYYKRELEKVKITPSADLWKQKIEPNLHSKKTVPMYWYRAAAAVALLLGTVFTWQYFDQSKQMANPNFPMAVDFEPTLLPEVVVFIPAPDIKTEHIAEVEEKPAPIKKVAKAEKRALAEALQTKNEPQKLEAQETAEPKAKPKYKIALSINSLKYAQTTVPEEQQQKENNTQNETGTSLGDYAKNQWTNIKSGEKLNAPPKEWFNLPKLALRVEGNPVKGVLNPSE